MAVAVVAAEAGTVADATSRTDSLPTLVVEVSTGSLVRMLLSRFSIGRNRSMAKNRPKHSNQRARAANSSNSATRSLHRPPEVTQRTAPVVYGKAFIVLEDEAKNTFIFKGGAWVAHTASIAECRQSCQVKELPQRVNKMTRYEVRCPE